MSTPNSTTHGKDYKRAKFVKHLLHDVEALDIMLKKGMVESDKIRIGAEQEFCIVNENWRPSRRSAEILEEISDSKFTTELARYNMELNLDPLELRGDCFSKMEEVLNDSLNRADLAAEKYQDKVILTGILPTISKNELDLDFMTPNPRYIEINDMIRAVRGTDFELHIKGIDELSVQHQSVLFEACNTSFQTHLQIEPDDFIASYNWAQAISGPILGVCANSPLLLGRELWSETRIALFQQSIDTRASSFAIKDQISRVNFGTNWETHSVVNIFKNAIARFRIILSCDIDQDALATLERGDVPKLKALNLHNSTVYRWNRPCYGVTDGKPHLRIENRYLPSGPTTIDEVANFALWVGLMRGRPSKFDDIATLMEFKDAKGNFIKAARTGKESVMRWMGEQLSVRELMTKHLLPIAHEGLRKCSIAENDIERYLGIIEQRTNGRTGAQWMIGNYRHLRESLRKDNAALALTKAIHHNQRSGLAVHSWPSVDSGLETHEAAHTVEHVMNTDLYTISESDSAELAINVMDWNNIHHIPVEDAAAQLVGILTFTHLERFRKRGGVVDGAMVKDVMTKDVITAEMDTEISEAIKVMKKHEIGSLPVVHGNHLVGIVTIEDVKSFDHDHS